MFLCLKVIQDPEPHFNPLSFMLCVWPGFSKCFRQHKAGSTTVRAHKESRSVLPWRAFSGSSKPQEQTSRERHLWFWKLFLRRWQVLCSSAKPLLKHSHLLHFAKPRLHLSRIKTWRFFVPPASSYLVYVLPLLLHGFQDVLRWISHVDNCLYALPLASRESLL